MTLNIFLKYFEALSVGFQTIFWTIDLQLDVVQIVFLEKNKRDWRNFIFYSLMK